MAYTDIDPTASAADALKNETVTIQQTSSQDAAGAGETAIKMPESLDLKGVKVYFLANPKSMTICNRLAELLEERGWFAAALDCRQQAVKLARTEDEIEEAFWQYLLAQVRAGNPSVDAEVREFKRLFAGSRHAIGIDDTVASVREEAQRIRKLRRLEIWTLPLSHWGQNTLDQQKALLRTWGAMMPERKLEAIEFLHAAIQRHLPKNAGLWHALAQMQSALKWSASASSSYAQAARYTPNVRLAHDCLIKSVKCLIDSGDIFQAKNELNKLKAQGIPEDAINYLRQTLQSAEAPVGSSTGVQKDDPPKAPAPAKIPVEYLPYPKRLICTVHHRAGHINLHPIAFESAGTWHPLPQSDAKVLFPNFGAAGILYSNAADTRALKEEHCYFVTLDEKNVVPCTDANFKYSLDAHFGHEIQPLDKACFIVVYPEKEDFNLLEATPVTARRNVTGQLDMSPLSDEMALLDTGEALVGPFRLRTMGQGKLYIPALSPQQLLSVQSYRQTDPSGKHTLWSTRQDYTSFVAFDAAFVNDSRCFTKGWCNLMSDAALVFVLKKRFPQFPDLDEIRNFIEYSPVLSDPENRKQLRRMLDGIRDRAEVSKEMSDYAVDLLLDRLQAEEGQTSQPATNAVRTAIEASPHLEEVRKKLADNRESIEAENRRELERLQAEHQTNLDRLAAEINDKKLELERVQKDIEEKKSLWTDQLKRMVDKAKTEIAQKMVAPLFEDAAPNGIATSAQKSSPAQTAQGTREEKNVDYAARARSEVGVIRTASGTSAVIRNGIIEEFMLRRGYTHDEVANIFIGVANNFLTVFSGDPGSGKTSGCGILAEALGLRGLSPYLSGAPGWEDARFFDRFLPVAVERGWTSKRDFLGYFNPLSQSFNASDARRNEAFRLLDAEARSGEGGKHLPFLMLLDEANLSPMEYYWADFMGICDGVRPEDREIVLGDRTVIRIPDHMRFLATINIDDTTEALSPRLIDRAWFVRLPAALPFSESVTETTPAPISWNDFISAFGGRGNPASQGALRFETFCIHFQKAGMHVSMRSRRAAERYIGAATPILDGGVDAAVDYAVAQKLLPMIRSSGLPFRSWLVELQELCEKLPVSRKIVETILVRGDTNLNFYQFL